MRHHSSGRYSSRVRWAAVSWSDRYFYSYQPFALSDQPSRRFIASGNGDQNSGSREVLQSRCRHQAATRDIHKARCFPGQRQRKRPPSLHWVDRRAASVIQIVLIARVLSTILALDAAGENEFRGPWTVNSRLSVGSQTHTSDVIYAAPTFRARCRPLRLGSSK
jgi:hypothetical protein